MQTYEIHPVAEMMPGLSDQEMQALISSIRKNGQMVPVFLYEGKIIDGRHRYWACVELGIDVLTTNFPDGSMSITDIVDMAIAINVNRRSLTTSQKAALAANALPLYEEEAKKRQGTRTDITANLQEGSTGQSTEFAAAAFSVSTRYVAYAKAIKDWDEVTFQAVVRGEMGLQDAAKLMKKQMDDAIPPDEADKPIRVPNPPQKWDADVKYEVYAGGEHISTFFFNSDTLQWDAQYHVS